jgi:hypothetical protein
MTVKGQSSPVLSRREPLPPGAVPVTFRSMKMGGDEAGQSAARWDGEA